MIRCRVHINETQIVDVHAVREPVFRGVSKHHEYTVYITEGGSTKNSKEIGKIKHKYSLGASRLSVRMLQMYYRHVDE